MQKAHCQWWSLNGLNNYFETIFSIETNLLCFFLSYEKYIEFDRKRDRKKTEEYILITKEYILNGFQNEKWNKQKVTTIICANI